MWLWNMQLQVAKTGNANQQKNGNSQSLPGYHARVSSVCVPRRHKPFDGLEDCRDFCGCSFFVALDVIHELCGCCKYPLDILPGQPDSVTLYEKKKNRWLYL